MNKFKVGDWCFYNFRFGQIKEMDDDKITTFSDGIFTSHGSNLTPNCFSVDMKIKEISDNVEFWNNELHNIKMRGLNYPEFNRKLISMWLHACNNKNDGTFVLKVLRDVAAFVETIKSKAEDIKYTKVDDIPLFG